MLGAWQWPYRGVRVGEASHPGPILVDGDHFPETAVGSDMDETQETAGGATTAASLSMEVDDLFGDLLAPPAIDLDTAVPSIPVPPPPPPDVLGNGRVLRCPFCLRYSTEGQARHLIRHMNCKHAGAKIEPHARTLLEALERGRCINKISFSA